MKIKICAERLTEDKPLTLEEQQTLLDDVLMLSAITVAYEMFCKSIGKLEEAKEFIGNFLESLENDELKNIMNGKGGDA